MRAIVPLVIPAARQIARAVLGDERSNGVFDSSGTFAAGSSTGAHPFVADSVPRVIDITNRSGRADAHDRDLVERIRVGDRRAFEELVREHYTAMCSVAVAMLRSRDTVEDIAQDVLRKLWVRRTMWQPRGPIRAYLLLATRTKP